MMSPLILSSPLKSPSLLHFLFLSASQINSYGKNSKYDKTRDNIVEVDKKTKQTLKIESKTGVKDGIVKEWRGRGYQICDLYPTSRAAAAADVS